MGVIWWEKLAFLREGWRAPAADIREKVCNRLTAGRALQKVLICTPARREQVCRRLRRGKFYIRLQFVRLAAVAFLLLV